MIKWDMWFYFSLLSGLFYSVQGLVTRKILKGAGKDSWAFSFFFSLIGAAVSLPFFVSGFKVSRDFRMWLLLSAAAAFIVIQNFLQFKSVNYLSPTLTGSLNKFRLVWIFIIGILVLSEPVTKFKIAGTALTIIAGLLILKKLKSKINTAGIIYAFASTFFYAVVILFYKTLFRDFNSQSLTFFIFLFPALINVFVMPDSINRIKKIAAEDGWRVALACAFGAFANLSMNQALSIGQASKVNALIESSLVIIFVGENIFLKEKDNLKIKLIAAVLAIAGAIMLRLG